MGSSYNKELQDLKSSVERGWKELHSGLGKKENEHDDFFESLKRDIRTKTP